MTDDAADPRPVRGQALTALCREDLDPYSQQDLAERIEALQGEIARVQAQIAKKSSVRSSADALFSFKSSGEAGS
jgi:uncharacterized small protein (DUF1192 family)